MNKILLIILGIAVLVFVVLVTLSEEVEIADWQIYKSEEYGFEIKYPKEWLVSESEGELAHINFYNGTPDRKDYQNLKNLVTISILFDYSSLEEWKMAEETLLREDIKKGDVSVSREEVTIGDKYEGKRILLVGKVGDSEVKTAEIGVFKDGKIYKFSQMIPKDCHLLECEAFNQMLSTFRFLD